MRFIDASGRELHPVTRVNREACTVESIINTGGIAEILMGFSYGPHLRTEAGARACARRHAIAICSIRSDKRMTEAQAILDGTHPNIYWDDVQQACGLDTSFMWTAETLAPYVETYR